MSKSEKNLKKILGIGLKDRDSKLEKYYGKIMNVLFVIQIIAGILLVYSQLIWRKLLGHACERALNVISSENKDYLILNDIQKRIRPHILTKVLK